MLIIKFPNIETYIESQCKYSDYIIEQIKKYNNILYEFDEIPVDVLSCELLIQGKINTYILINCEHDLDNDMLMDNINIIYSMIEDDEQIVIHPDSEELPRIYDLFYRENSCSDYEHFSNYRKNYHSQLDKFKDNSIHVINGKLMKSSDIIELLKPDIESIESLYTHYKNKHDNEIIEKEKKRKQDINDILKILIDEHPTNFITENSYVRYCLYEALDMYALQYGKVWVQRIKKKKDLYAEYPMCKKHKCRLTGGCDCCSDPWCCGPNCDMCFSNPCNYAVDEGDFLYNAKVTVSLQIYYKREDIGKRLLKYFPRNK